MNERKSNSSVTFEINSLLRDLLHNLWVIVLAGLIGLMAVFIHNHSVYTPQYTSTATLLVNVKTGASQAYTTLSASSEMARIYSEVFVQPTMRAHAAAYLGMDAFSGSVSARALEDTNIFTVSVTSGSPELSYRELNAILKVYPEISQSVFSDSVIEIMRYPSVPKAPSNMLVGRSRTFAVLACVLLTAGAIMVISLLRDTVKNEAAFHQKIGCTLIGTVIHEHRHQKLTRRFIEGKRSLLISNAFASFHFTENYQKIANRLDYMHRSTGDRVFLITSVAENEGKSTSAANIALALASRGSKVILLDMDFKKPAMQKIFDIKIDREHDFGSMLGRKIPASEFKLQEYRRGTLFTALNAGRHADYVNWIHSDFVAEFIQSARRRYDFVIVDTPPLSVAADVTHLSELADRTILVVRTDCAMSADINDAILTIRESSDKFAGVILNDLPHEFSLFGQTGFDESGYYHTAGYHSYGSRYGHSGYGRSGYGRSGYESIGSFDFDAEDSRLPEMPEDDIPEPTIPSVSEENK